MKNRKIIFIFAVIVLAVFMSADSVSANNYSCSLNNTSYADQASCNTGCVNVANCNLTSCLKITNVPCCARGCTSGTCDFNNAPTCKGPLADLVPYKVGESCVSDVNCIGSNANSSPNKKIYYYSVPTCPISGGSACGSDNKCSKSGTCSCVSATTIPEQANYCAGVPFYADDGCGNNTAYFGTKNCPVCGSANGGSFLNAPAANLCSTGTSSSVTQAGNNWNWTCSNAGTSVSCSAAKTCQQTADCTPSSFSGSGCNACPFGTENKCNQWNNNCGAGYENRNTYCKLNGGEGRFRVWTFGNYRAYNISSTWSSWCNNIYPSPMEPSKNCGSICAANSTVNGSVYSSPFNNTNVQWEIRNASPMCPLAGGSACSGTPAKCTAPVACAVLPQCSDGVDNDGDGKIDLVDSGCADANDNDETNPCDNSCASSKCVTETCVNSCGITINGTMAAAGNSCGTAKGKTFQTQPSSNLCALGSGDSFAATASGWKWNCPGICGGASENNCSANKARDKNWIEIAP